MALPPSSHDLNGVYSSSGYRARYSLKPMLSRIKRSDASIIAAIRKVAPKIQRSIKARAPVDTGRLQSTVNVSVIGTRSKDPRIVVRTVGYGYFQEFGTKNMAAQPFVNPVIGQATWERQIRSIAKSIEEGTKR